MTEGSKIEDMTEEEYVGMWMEKLKETIPESQIQEYFKEVYRYKLKKSEDWKKFETLWMNQFQDGRSDGELLRGCRKLFTSYSRRYDLLNEYRRLEKMRNEIRTLSVKEYSIFILRWLITHGHSIILGTIEIVFTIVFIRVL